MQVPFIHKANPTKEIIFRICFQVIPTVLAALYLLWMGNLQLSLLRGQHLQQASFFGMGMFFATLLYQTRIRLVPSFAVLIIIGWLVAQGLRNWVNGDVEPFFVTHKFYVYFVIFCIGWLVAFGLSRIRFWSVLTALLLVGGSIYLASFIHTSVEGKSFVSFLIYLIPIIIYGVYIIYISEQIRDYRLFGNLSFGKLFLKALIFNGIAAACGGLVLFIFQAEIQETLDKIQAGSYKEQNSMLQKNEDGSSIKTSTSMTGSNNRNKELLMLAYIDNYFEQTQVPNPLYMVTFYYAQFDTATETFVETNDMPDKDLYRPDVSKIPLYHTAVDSSVLAFSQGSKLTKTVEIEVYNKGMTASAFAAPSTAFFVQPIVVDQAFQAEYKSAYRAKSVVSDLNSAYFVYNINKPEVEAFQQARFKVLSQVQDFSTMDSTAFAYYTYMPDIENLRAVKILAAEIEKGKRTPIEKVTAVRDYFLQKDANGKAIFKYSDNPGIPDIPSASKLNYFLFQNKKGYCAHYAGATLFLLRSMGIPARITAGFLTEDRSTANPGWYYFYADQVHAWVQIYFPGFGWLDFDTTVGNEDARESEQPDATPPLQPAKAALAISGYIQQVDTGAHTLQIAALSATALDKNYHSENPEEIKLDISIARVIRDTSSLSINQLKVGDTITAITYGKGVVNEIPVSSSLGSLTHILPQPVPVDHIQIRPQQKGSHITNEVKVDYHSKDWYWLIAVGCIVLIFFVIIQSIPYLIKVYYRRNSQSSHLLKSAYYQYVTSLYHLWMLRIRKREKETSLQFAERIDAKYGTSFAVFMRTYLKLKYSQSPLSKEETVLIRQFSEGFIQKIIAHISVKERRYRWLHVKLALQFAWLKKEL